MYFVEQCRTGAFSAEVLADEIYLRMCVAAFNATSLYRAEVLPAYCVPCAGLSEEGGLE